MRDKSRLLRQRVLLSQILGASVFDQPVRTEFGVGDQVDEVGFAGHAGAFRLSNVELMLPGPCRWYCVGSLLRCTGV